MKNINTGEPINLLRCKVLGKGFLRNADIAQIVPCSTGKATDIIKGIKHKNAERFRLFSHSVYTDEFINYMEWDMETIEGQARREKDLYSP
jgi:hypothetical protein